MYISHRYLSYYAWLLLIVIGVHTYYCFTGSTNDIRIVGSTTVYPFMTTISEFIVHNYHQRSPIIEPTGSGIGASMFCGASSKSSPHVLMMSRLLYDSEITQCQNSHIKWQHHTLGQELFVLITNPKSPLHNLSLRDLFLASAQLVPVDNKIVKNPYKTWKEINHDLPNIPILIRGPHHTSGTYEIFVKKIMQAGAKDIPRMQELAKSDPELFQEMTTLLRQDGKFISSTNVGSIVISKVLQEIHTVGLVGFSFYQEHTHDLKLLSLNNHLPSMDRSQENKYPLQKTLNLYIRQTQHINDRLSYIVLALKNKLLQDKLQKQGLINHE